MENRKPVSMIETEKYTYFNLHAEEVFFSNYSREKGDGIYVFDLNLNTFDVIMNFISNSSQNKVIVLDFNGIKKLQPNLVDKLAKLKEIVVVVLLNIEKSIVDSEIGINVVKNINNKIIKIDDTEIYEYYYYFSEDKSEIYNFTIEVEKLFKDEFLKRIKTHIKTEKYYHSSSSVYLKSYVNLKAFMTVEKEFAFFALYLLAMKIKRKDEWKIKVEKRSDYDTPKVHDKILVCQSLNGSYITSILSTLLKMDILIFDKIGPINKLYSRPNKLINIEKEYIVVSDLVCLGTEVKIAKNILEFFGAKYLGNIALVKTETVKNPKDPTTAVFSINQTNCEELKFDIYTNLKKTQQDG